MFAHPQLRLKQQLLRSKDGNGNCSCGDFDVEFAISSGVLALCFAFAPDMSSIGDKSIQLPMVYDAEVRKAGFLNQTGLGADR